MEKSGDHSDPSVQFYEREEENPAQQCWPVHVPKNYDDHKGKETLLANSAQYQQEVELQAHSRSKTNG